MIRKIVFIIIIIISLVYGDQMYNMNQAMVGGAGGEAMGMLNPQINPMVLNQLLAAAQAQAQQNAAAGGLYVPQQQAPQQQQPQQQQSPIQMNDHDSRRSRPAAIPIKPPPGFFYFQFSCFLF